MNNYKEINGDLIQLAITGEFDVIAHGCNCFATQKSGIAAQMVSSFRTNTFPMERIDMVPIDRLSNIDWQVFNLPHDAGKKLTVVNAYTQYNYGTSTVNVDYDALRICMRKMNIIFRGQHIGLPQIGCGLAGGDWNIVQQIIKDEIKDCEITVVIYKKR